MSPSENPNNSEGASSPSLPRLMPVAVAPAERSPSTSSSSHELEGSATAAVLRRIMAIEVGAAVDDEGKPCYRIGVFLHSARSRLPVPTVVVPGRGGPSPPSLTACKANGRAPDVVAFQGFDAFRKLRDAVYYAAHDGHSPGEGVAWSCAFCTGALNAVVLDQTQPHRYDEWMRSTAVVCSRLEVFLHDLVARARGDPPPSSSTTTAASRRAIRPRCIVQANVQTFVVQFLQLDQPRPAGAEDP